MSLSRVILLTSLILLSKTPFKVLILLGFILGNVFYIIPNPFKATTRINLNMAFPGRNKIFINNLIKKSLIESCINLLVTGKVWAFPEKFDSSSLVKVQGLEEIRQSLEQKNGVIIFTPHMGSIDLIIYILSKNFNCTIPYTPAKKKSLDKIMSDKRKGMGASMVKANIAGVKFMLDELSNKGIVAIAPDQVPNRSHGIFSNFFGKPALTLTLVSKLAKQTLAPCHSVYCLRLKAGSGYKIIFSKQLKDFNSIETKEGVNLMNRELEKCIMFAPEQYAWEYKRYKHSTSKDPYFNT